MTSISSGDAANTEPRKATTRISDSRVSPRSPLSKCRITEAFVKEGNTLCTPWRNTMSNLSTRRHVRCRGVVRRRYSTLYDNEQNHEMRNVACGSWSSANCAKICSISETDRASLLCTKVSEPTGLPSDPIPRCLDFIREAWHSRGEVRPPDTALMAYTALKTRRGSVPRDDWRQE